jgi:hypothetical protein
MIEFAYFFSCSFDFSALGTKKMCAKRVRHVGLSSSILFICLQVLSPGLWDEPQLIWLAGNNFGWFGRLLTLTYSPSQIGIFYNKWHMTQNVDLSQV